MNLIAPVTVSTEDIKLNCMSYVCSEVKTPVMEITTEADINDSTECLHDDRSSTGMFCSSVFYAYFTCLCTMVYGSLA